MANSKLTDCLTKQDWKDLSRILGVKFRSNNIDIVISIPVDGVITVTEQFLAGDDSDQLMTDEIIDGMPFPEQGETCPHGQEHSECDACMVLSDHLYDAGREDRMFGR